MVHSHEYGLPKTLTPLLRMPNLSHESKEAWIPNHVNSKKSHQDGDSDEHERRGRKGKGQKHKADFLERENCRRDCQFGPLPWSAKSYPSSYLTFCFLLCYLPFGQRGSLEFWGCIPDLAKGW